MIRGRSSSPLRAKAKRRQSDAKWRASVATCYDALKYVVPNVKNMTKRKISKALILQESERHIKELEEAVSQLLEVESKKRGKTVLWKDGPQWSHCTLDKLRLDFSEKQQRVFHMAAHGRRCYNLLQDIKEDVFAMEADPGQLAVLQEALPSTSSSLSSSIVVAGGTVAASSGCGGRELRVQGVQPARRLSLVLSGLGKASRQQSQAGSVKQKLNNKPQGQRIKFHIETVNGDFYIVPDPKSSIAHLIKVPPLEARKEQEVPSMKLPLKPPRESEHRQTESSVDSRKLTSLKLKVSQNHTENPVAQACSEETEILDHSAVEESMPVNGPVGPYTVTVSAEAALVQSPKQKAQNSPVVVPGVKEEPNTPKNNQDPLLSSLATPKFDETTPLFVRTENNMVLRRRPRFGSARKKLNFGVSHMTTPDKQGETSAAWTPSKSGGFTPIKLPDEFGMVPDMDGASLGSLVSPWKIVSSPSFESRIAPQNYLDSSSVLDPYDSLVCLESIDTMDLGDEDDSDCHNTRKKTKASKDKTPQVEESCKRKIPDSSPHAGGKPEPKCRKKLDRFYDSPTYCHNNGYEDDSDLVPDICVPSKEEPINLDHEGSDFCDGLSSQNTNNPGIASNTEESHIVPDLDTVKKSGHDQVDRRCENFGQCSLEVDAINTASDCDDFDGFYLYYRHMSHQLRQKASRTTTLKGNKETFQGASIASEPNNVSIPTFSSPSVAARVAHMWSRLPLQDRLAMSRLASLEDRSNRTDTSSQHRGTTNSHTHQASVMDSPQTDGGQGSLIDSYSSMHSSAWVGLQDRCSNLVQGGHVDGSLSGSLQGRSHGTFQVSQQDFGNGGNSHFQGVREDNLEETIHGVVPDDSAHSKEGGYQGMQHELEFDVSSGPDVISPFRSITQHRSSYTLQDEISPFKGLSDLDNIYDALHSYGRDAVTSNPQDLEVPASPEDLVLGGLSQDLQDVDVQPLIDHTYGHSLDL